MRSRTLWDHEVDVEVLQSLAAIYAKLSSSEQQALVTAILQGPQAQFDHLDGLSAEQIQYLIFLRLDALGPDALRSHPTAAAQHAYTIKEHPSWSDSLSARLVRRESSIMTGSAVRQVSATITPQALVEEILDPESNSRQYWHSVAGFSFDSRMEAIKLAVSRVHGEHAVSVLLTGIDRQELGEASNRRLVLHAVVKLPAHVLRQSIHELATVLRSCAENATSAEIDIILEVWTLLLPHCLAADDQAASSGPPDYLSRAINNPCGRITEALLRVLNVMQPKLNEGLSSDIASRLQAVIKSDHSAAIYGRVLISSRLYLLSWIDLPWTVREVTPLLSWANAREASAAWQGYLWGPQIDSRLFQAIRVSFFEAFAHMDELGGMEENLCGLLVSLGLDAPGLMQSAEVRGCFRSMGSRGRKQVAWLLAKRLQSTEEEKRQHLWNDRIDKWLREHWPPEKEYADAEVSDNLAWAATLAGAAYPEAVRTVVPLLTSTRRPLMSLHSLEETDRAKTAPEETLVLLDRLLVGGDYDHLYGLGKLLSAIKDARPTLTRDSRFRRLWQLARAAGELE